MEGQPIPASTDTIVGRWAGDRVVLIGDYDESKLWDELPAFRNVTAELVEAWNEFIEIPEMKLKFVSVRRTQVYCRRPWRQRRDKHAGASLAGGGLRDDVKDGGRNEGPGCQASARGGGRVSSDFGGGFQRSGSHSRSCSGGGCGWCAKRSRTSCK